MNWTGQPPWESQGINRWKHLASGVVFWWSEDSRCDWLHSWVFVIPHHKNFQLSLIFLLLSVHCSEPYNGIGHMCIVIFFFRSSIFQLVVIKIFISAGCLPCGNIRSCIRTRLSRRRWSDAVCSGQPGNPDGLSEPDQPGQLSATGEHLSRRLRVCGVLPGFYLDTSFTDFEIIF